MKNKTRNINLFKKLFNKRKKNNAKNIILSNKDDKGFCDVHISGEKANFRVLVFDKD